MKKRVLMFMLCAMLAISGVFGVNITAFAADEIVATPPTFAEVTVGYAQPAAQPITITNTSAEIFDLGTFKVTGSGLTVIGELPDVLNAGESTTALTVQPDANLPAGTHSVNVEIYDGDDLNVIAVATVSIKVVNLSATITFDLNGGKGSVPTPFVGNIGDVIHLPAQGVITSENLQILKGWNTKADGTGDSYASEALYTITENITLYAIWGTTLTIDFDLNGGGGTAPTSIEVVPNSDTTLPGAAGMMAPQGKSKFIGWNTQADGLGYHYPAEVSTRILLQKNTKLYAIWENENNIVTVNFLNAHKELYRSIDVILGATIVLPDPGKEFNYYNSSVNENKFFVNWTINSTEYQVYEYYTTTAKDLEAWTIETIINVYPVMDESRVILSNLCTVLSLFGEGEEADTFRNFRDGVLAQTDTGQKLTALYYEASPEIVQFLQDNPFWAGVVKNYLSVLSNTLQPYFD